MNSSSTVSIKQEPAAQIVYRYSLDINDGSGGLSKRNYRTITEYFIPSSRICFNELAVFESVAPRNLSTSKFFHRGSEPLTAIALSKELINEVENAVTKFNNPEAACNSLKENEEYQLLFKNKQRDTKLVNNEIVFIKNCFWSSFKNKGNSIIKKAIVQYILDGTTPNDIGLNELVQLAKKLNHIEKESLIVSINRTLSIKDGKLAKTRSNAIKDIKKKHGNVITSGILGGVGGAIISSVSRLNPVISIGLGFFGASALNHIEGIYKKYNENQLWDQREKRTKMIIDMINDLSKNDTKLTNSY